jgi:pimeloyl-ACP methyl ester carboxylesterase
MLINGHGIHVETLGPTDGPGVILLHHGLGSTRAWKEQLPALAEAGFHVLAYDRWGYGQSEERQGLGIPAFTQDIADLKALMDQANMAQAALVGHSDGGTIALYFAAQYPECVTRLVTIAAHIYIEPKMEPGIMNVQYAFEQDARFRAGLRRVHGEKFEEVFHNWFDGWHQPDCLSWDMRPILHKITCPTLVVQGSQDEHATPQHARDIADAIPEARLWLVPGAGHMLPQENAAQFNPRLLEFLV